MNKLITIRKIYELEYSDLMKLETLTSIKVQGWIRTNRSNGSIGFIEINDGTYFKNIQVVYSKENLDENKFLIAQQYLTGTAVTIEGKIVLTTGGKQTFELLASDIILEAACDNTYPLQKKRHSFEFLREISHLRPRTNAFSAVFRVRSVLAMAIHEFFQKRNFVYVHSPIITGPDAEGIGQSFTATVRKDGNYKEDFFGKQMFLTGTGQLHGEAFALAFKNIYTFGPTFRAENSNTTRHVAEFWMIEPEIAFADLNDNMVLIEDLVKFCIDYILKNCQTEINFFNEMIDKELLARLKKTLNSNFAQLTYTKVISLLEDAVIKGYKFEFKEIVWGMDLQSEHEKYICENITNGPVFVTDYPKDLKAFYMRLNDDNKTVSACDLLVPAIGELVGGSAREERYDYLLSRINEIGMNAEELDWYLDLRKYGGVKHAGFGIGFERLIMYLTGMTNIRDVIPFARTPKNGLF